MKATFLIVCPGFVLQRLNSLQELQLLEIMCNYFQEQTKDSVRQIIFSSLFSPQGNKADDSRMSLLGKLVSMAVAVCRVPVLECAASWLQVLLPRVPKDRFTIRVIYLTESLARSFHMYHALNHYCP